MASGYNIRIMDRAGPYFERAIRAYHNRDWDDLLLQLCPCIEAAAAHELGNKGRSSFRKYVDNNLKYALYVLGGPSFSNLSIAIRAKGYFDERAVRELEKAHQPEDLQTTTCPIM